MLAIRGIVQLPSKGDPGARRPRRDAPGVSYANRVYRRGPSPARVRHAAPYLRI